jgi:hypothetical protein
VGTSTSGQAARTLGREAGIATSRTLASLNWRIAHGDLRLSERHVAVLDEAAMADDAALVAFLEAAQLAGAKVVAVGDPCQLGAVGPGGGFEALLARFGDAVHVLADNVRQHDPAERVALEERARGTWRRPCRGMRTPGASPCPPIETPPSMPWSPAGPPTWPTVPRRPCTPGGGPTWPS